MLKTTAFKKETSRICMVISSIFYDTKNINLVVAETKIFTKHLASNVFFDRLIIAFIYGALLLTK